MTDAQITKSEAYQVFHRRLNAYINAKEHLSRDNLLAWEFRGARIGYLTSFYPIVSILAILRNYSNHLGLWHKLWNWRSPYKSGENTLFPNLRRFWGAKYKDFSTGRTNLENLGIRQKNIGYALQLILHLDAIQLGNQPAISFEQAVYEQLEIKRFRREGTDGYARLLQSLLPIPFKPEKLIEPGYLQRKAQYLDYLATHTTLDSYERGQKYDYLDPGSDEGFDPALIWQQVKKPLASKVEKINPPRLEFSHPDRGLQVALTQYARMLDKGLFLELDPSRFSDYRIRGCSTNGLLVGKDETPLTDGWYQYVIMKNTAANQPPIIRYYQCGQRTDDLPLCLQDPQREGAVNDEGYWIQKPKVFRLPYRKFVTHTEIAGDRIPDDEEVVVQGAGAFMLKEGQLRVLDDSSGHYYLPKEERDKNRTLKFACEVFKHYGVDTRHTVLVRWEPYFGTDRLCEAMAAGLMQFKPRKELQDRKLSPKLALDGPIEPGEESPIQALITIG